MVIKKIKDGPMYSSEFFSELNIQILRVCAQRWALQHPVIKKISLCASVEAGVKYVLLIHGPKVPDTKNKIGKRTRENPDAEIIFPDAEKDALFFDKISFFNWTSEDCLHIREDLSTVYKDEAPFDFMHNWMWYNLEEGEDLPDFIHKDEEFICTLYERKESNSISNFGKKLRPNQKHKIECRKIASKIWENDPKVTIADMILRDEIAKVCETKVYCETTLRNWIKDLCPDRSPGRRPKKK